MVEVTPLAVYVGKYARELLRQLAFENGMASRFFVIKLIIREARAEATMLTLDKMKKRMELIGKADDELVDLINHPPKELLTNRDPSRRPKSIYAKIWDAHKRLAKQGQTPEQIHEFCLDRYGMDYDIKPTPNKSPKRNPNWVGGGRYAKKIKQAKMKAKREAEKIEKIEKIENKGKTETYGEDE